MSFVLRFCLDGSDKLTDVTAALPGEGQKPGRRAVGKRGLPRSKIVLSKTGGLYHREQGYARRSLILCCFFYSCRSSVIPCKLTSVGGLGIRIPTNAIDDISVTLETTSKLLPSTPGRVGALTYQPLVYALSSEFFQNKPIFDGSAATVAAFRFYLPSSVSYGEASHGLTRERSCSERGCRTSSNARST